MTVTEDLGVTEVLGIVFFRSLILSPSVPTTGMQVVMLVLYICVHSLTSHNPNLTQTEHAVCD